jgi:hypothetical protein
MTGETSWNIWTFRFTISILWCIIQCHFCVRNVLKCLIEIPTQPFEIEQCWTFAVLWRPFWKWRPVEIFQCRESIRTLKSNNVEFVRYCGAHFENGRFGRLHNRYIIMISCFIYFELLFGTILIMRVYKYYYIFRIIFRSRSSLILRPLVTGLPILCRFHKSASRTVQEYLPIRCHRDRFPFSKWPPQYRKNSTLFDFKGRF